MKKVLFEVQVNGTVKLTQEVIDGIMCTALEGGITYWCESVLVIGKYKGTYASEQISRGGSLNLYDAESEEIYPLTLEMFLNGFKQWLEKDGDEYGAVEDGEVDCSNIDAECADAIIQYALFQDVIYG